MKDKNQKYTEDYSCQVALKGLENFLKNSKKNISSLSDDVGLTLVINVIEKIHFFEIQYFSHIISLIKAFSSKFPDYHNFIEAVIVLKLNSLSPDRRKSFLLKYDIHEIM